MKKSFVAGLAVLAVAAMVGSAAHAREVYGSFGTEGVGVGYSQPIGTYSNVRAEVNGFSIGHNFTAGDVDYDGTLKLVHAGIYADFFPAPSVVPFRFTAGMLIGDDELNATASSMSGSYTFNGVTVPANGQQVRATAKFPAVRPYVGIGFGHTPKGKKGFSAAFDAGVAFGKPHLTYDVPADIVQAAGQDNVNAEEQSLQDKVNKVRFYPIVKVSVTYRF